MSSADLDSDTVTHTTLSLLETRLRRLEFLLTGSVSQQGESRPADAPLINRSNGDDTVNGQLKRLQADLQRLRNLRGTAGDIVRDVESLRLKAPEAFAASNLPAASALSDISVISSVVLSHATMFPECASRLSSLQSLEIPSAEQSHRLIDLHPRVDMALQKQEDLVNQAEQLRERSAKCLEWWVKSGIVGMGELWEDWESRVHEVERGVKRVERRNAEREGYL